MVVFQGSGGINIFLTSYHIRHWALCLIFLFLKVAQTEKAMAAHSSTLAWKIHGWRSLVGCNPWGPRESDTTERLHFHFSLSCIGEGNGNPLQYSCLENPRDGGALWAAIYWVAQSRTRLKRLSSSSRKKKKDLHTKQTNKQ